MIGMNGETRIHGSITQPSEITGTAKPETKIGGNVAGEAQVSASVSTETNVSALIAAEARVLGLMPVAAMIAGDWVISMIPIQGGNRLIARRGSEIQQMDILNGFMGVIDDGEGNVELY